MDRGLDVPKVKDIMTGKVIALLPEFTIFDAIKIFNEYRIGSVPIVNNEYEVVGFLSESDCLKVISNWLFYDQGVAPSISSLMVKDVLSVQSDWDLFELESFFNQNQLKAAPVINSEGHLVGMVTRRDILKNLETLMSSRSDFKIKSHTPVELSFQDKARMIVNTRIARAGQISLGG